MPSDDTGLLSWYAADDTGTLPVTGTEVDAWADKAGAENLDQTNVACRPTSGTRVINGLNFLDFDGANFLAGPVSLSASGDVSVHMVVEIDAVTNAFQSILAMDATRDFQIDTNSDTAFDGRLFPAVVAPEIALSGGHF